jgi:hypothetical protein
MTFERIVFPPAAHELRDQAERPHRGDDAQERLRDDREAVLGSVEGAGEAQGSYQHCVMASDAAGNKSSVSCATVNLR